MGVVKLVLLLLVVAAVITVVMRVRDASRRGAEVTFTAVSELPPDVVDRIDLALARDDKVTAIRLYREATGAGLVESKAAIDVRAWKRGA